MVLVHELGDEDAAELLLMPSGGDLRRAESLLEDEDLLDRDERAGLVADFTCEFGIERRDGSVVPRTGFERTLDGVRGERDQIRGTQRPPRPPSRIAPRGRTWRGTGPGPPSERRTRPPIPTLARARLGTRAAAEHGDGGS